MLKIGTRVTYRSPDLATFKGTVTLIDGESAYILWDDSVTARKELVSNLLAVRGK